MPKLAWIRIAVAGVLLAAPANAAAVQRSWVG
jgi:hypothetical protein